MYVSSLCIAESAALISGRRLAKISFAREAKVSLAKRKISLAKRFRFVCPQLTHRKHFGSQGREIFDFAVSNVIKALRPIFFRAFFSLRFPVVGQRSVTEFSLPNNSRYHRFSLLENQIPI